jgi:hypothetical protein
MKKTIYSIAMLLALAIRAQAANFVCIGLNEVTNYAVLASAESDASRMAETLVAKGHQAILLKGAEATRENILNATSNGDSIVYFAGHAEQEYVLTADGKLNLGEMARNVSTLLLDCCNVGNGIQENGSTRIMAAAEYEAFESDGQGLFSKYLIQWLDSGRSFADVEFEEYVRQNIMEETGGWQKPVFGFI